MTAPDRRRAPFVGPIRYSDHLVMLIARTEAAGGVLAGAEPDRRAEIVAQARRSAARLSARLDASPLTEEIADEVDRRLEAGQAPVEVAHVDQPEQTGGGGWARALKLEGMPTADVAAVEYANLLACFDAEPDLAATVFADPLAALRSLHGVLCAGLVDAAVVGRPRQTEQAVHDGVHGQVIYHAPPPDAVAGLLDQLASWLGETSATLPAVVVAGVVHERLLEWQPFEAANGRLARAFARLVLRARGLDPHGVAVPERMLATDPLGYVGEVAATIRRRGDLVPWLERWAEALCAGLEQAAAAVSTSLTVSAPSRALRVAEGLVAGDTLTLTEYAADAAVSREVARADLGALERAGLLALVPGTRGLRWRRR